MYSGSIDIKLF